MSILIDQNTRVLVQGITGRDGSFHAKGMLDYGTKVVGGVTPGKGGEQVHGIPVFNSVKEAVAATQANASVLYVPARFAAAAIREAADAGIPLIVAITEGIPTLDMLGLYHEVGARHYVDWAQLPRLDFTRQGQDRHHAGLHPQAGPGGGDLPQRNPDLRDRACPDPARARPVHLRGHRRRSHRGYPAG